MKALKTSLLALLAGTPAFAGGLADPIVEPTVIEEEAATGSRAGILVPILAILLIGLALSNNGDDAPTGE